MPISLLKGEAITVMNIDHIASELARRHRCC